MSWYGNADDKIFVPLYGVEVEVEGYPWFEGVHVDGWRVTEDGSLRNGGAEFVFEEPLNMEDSRDAVMRLYRRWQFVASVRCGIHVHMNAIGLSVEALISMLTVYAAAEPAIFHELCPGREENIFCVPWYLAPLDVRPVQVATNYAQVRVAASNYPKYSAMNLAPLRTLGTVEFRGMGTVDHPEPLLRMLDLCGQLHAAAVSGLEPGHIVREFERDPAGALERYVPAVASERGAELIDEYDSVSVAAGFVRTKPEQIDWTMPEMLEEVC